MTIPLSLEWITEARDAERMRVAWKRFSESLKYDKARDPMPDKLDIDTAIGVIESGTSATDDTSAVGEAWAVVMDELDRLRTENAALTLQLFEKSAAFDEAWRVLRSSPDRRTPLTKDAAAAVEIDKGIYIVPKEIATEIASLRERCRVLEGYRRVLRDECIAWRNLARKRSRQHGEAIDRACIATDCSFALSADSYTKLMDKAEADAANAMEES